MTAPALLGLTYDGTSIQEADLSVFLEIITGLYDGLEVRGQDVTVPYLAGQTWRNRRKDKRTISLSGILQGIPDDDAVASYKTVRRSVEALFGLDRDPADLVATFPDSSTATILCRPINHIPVVKVPDMVCEFTVMLVSVAPDWTFS